MSLNKRQKAFEPFDKLTLYTITEAIRLIKATATAKFNESIDAAVNLGIDPRKSDQMLRGSLLLPHGTGKKVVVAVFADGAQAIEAQQAGADIVGLEDLIQEIKQGKLNFNLAIATPEAMRLVGALGQILGPRGLMPNPKVGTVTNNIASAVRDAKAGQIQYRSDKKGIIHTSIGRASFTESDIANNLQALVAALTKAKPATAKGQYLQNITLSSTMGIGVKINLMEFAK
jgi:large subunit ribosomal protein L1